MHLLSMKLLLCIIRTRMFDLLIQKDQKLIYRHSIFFELLFSSEKMKIEGFLLQLCKIRRDSERRYFLLFEIYDRIM